MIAWLFGYNIWGLPPLSFVMCLPVSVLQICESQGQKDVSFAIFSGEGIANTQVKESFPYQHVASRRIWFTCHDTHLLRAGASDVSAIWTEGLSTRARM